MLADNEKNDALEAEDQYRTAVETANDYVENFDILETITNVGNDEVFTPRKTCDMLLDLLPEEVWHNPNYKWLNPATKNGIFEREIAIRLDNGLKDIISDPEERRKHILQNMIYSIGQTRFTANVARRTVYYCSQANRKCDGIKANDGHFVNGYAIGNGSWFDDEEGNIKTPNINHKFEDDKGRPMPNSCSNEEKKKFKCKYCRINGASAYNDANQRETYAYEFIHFDRDELLKHLQDRFFGGNREMKFDIIIGNPPYQLSDGGAGASSNPIYQLFVEQAISLKPKFISMIIPSRWMIGGRQALDDFRQFFINDTRIRVLDDFMNSKACFPSNDIKGGVCFFLWDKDFDNKCTITTHYADVERKSERFLKEDGCDIFIREEILISILHKVRFLNEKTFNELVSSSKPYGYRAQVMTCPDKFGIKAFSDKKIEGGYEILGLGEDKKRVWKYISKDFPIKKVSPCLNKYKVFIAEAYGNGTIGEIPSELVIGKPGQLCTETFLEIGPFGNEFECQNVVKYIKTKFFRILVGIQKQTQHTTKKVYQFVPQQNFTKDSDIKWHENIESICRQLYKKYKLSDEEIDYIEKMGKEMQ